MEPIGGGLGLGRGGEKGALVGSKDFQPMREVGGMVGAGFVRDAEIRAEEGGRPVPEPAAWALLTCGLGLLALVVVGQNRFKVKPRMPSASKRTPMRCLLRNKSGQTLVEYALILAFISVVAIVVLQALGSKVTSVFSTINTKLSTAQSAS